MSLLTLHQPGKSWSKKARKIPFIEKRQIPVFRSHPETPPLFAVVWHKNSQEDLRTWVNVQVGPFIQWSWTENSPYFSRLLYVNQQFRGICYFKMVSLTFWRILGFSKPPKIFITSSLRDLQLPYQNTPCHSLGMDIFLKVLHVIQQKKISPLRAPKIHLILQESLCILTKLDPPNRERKKHETTPNIGSQKASYWEVHCAGNSEIFFSDCSKIPCKTQHCSSKPKI